jgi:NAD(P)H dehydrogenase (quinone)
MADILVLYYSQSGATEALAREICKGVDAVGGMSARLRTVPAVSSVAEATDNSVPDTGPPYATNADLEECAGLILGSPSNFGNMAAPLKHFFDGTIGDWLRGVLVGKPAGVFASTGSLHGGQETTLLTEAALSTTTTGGTPYGPTHVTWNRSADALSDEEKQLAQALGKRVADIAKRLAD